jgi:hypothetical protein
MTVFNRSVAMMSDGAKTVPYDRKLKERDYSAFSYVVNSFIQPTPQNFSSLIIKNGSKVSNQIKEYQETTKSWLKGEQLKESVEEQPTQTAEEARDEALNYEAIEF